ncbi:hypothetical protein [Bradyrhizobium sp.]
MTRLKLAAINIVIVLGAIVIAYVQWPEAVKNSGFGTGGYNQGMIGTILLAILMAGIPIILFAIVAHLGLTWLLFRPGELEDYKARKLVESRGAKSPRPSQSSPDNRSPDNSLN